MAHSGRIAESYSPVVFTQPDGLNDDDVTETLLRGWGLVADNVGYAALGFGSHHWHAVAGDTQWFVTVDDLDSRRQNVADTRLRARQRLNAALSGAYALQRQGRSFVVAPVPSGAGSVLENVDERYVLALYPHIEGRAGSWGRYDTQAERFAVIDRLIDIHRATENVKGVVGVDDFGVPSRDQLTCALDETSSPWPTGPYAERTRALLARHSRDLNAALSRHDDLVVLVRNRRADPVVTHGEPHRGNVIFTPEGASLIDWDTTLLAPHERDLWSLIDEDPETGAYYTSKSGRPVDADALRLYRLWWDLCEISLYVAEFHSPHIDSVDTRTAWQGLEKYLDPRRWVEAN